MTELSQAWLISLTTLIAALPAIGALLLVYSQAKKRKLDAQEIAAVFLIFWGFLLFVSLEESLLPLKTAWYLGWGFPIFVGVIYTVIGAYLIYRKY